jgi:hypothetical protein
VTEGIMERAIAHGEMKWKSGINLKPLFCGDGAVHKLVDTKHG